MDEVFEPPLDVEREVSIGPRGLPGTLGVPDTATGVILFAHGSGSGRFSERNRHVARVLREAGLATLLFDLLDEGEAADRRKVFDVDLLAERLLDAVAWVADAGEVAALPVGYFGASTGAAAALAAAARDPRRVRAVVSRGGRPDLAMTDLPAVQAPTLLVVGGDDETVLELNRQALRWLRCPKELVVVPGATHLFPEPGALDQVARVAGEWFLRYLVAAEPDAFGPRRPR